ncbi:MAG: WG repeat-containing protein, partial [Planctomycetaceae bacterium]|nr:WG repeat-containing protein [Planctomycetaceae bacterium]
MKMKVNLNIGRYVILGLFIAALVSCNIINAQVVIQSDKIQTASETPEPKDDTDEWQLFSYKGRVGFLCKDGGVVIPAKYDHAYGFTKGLARVKLGDKYGFIDTTGKEIIPLKYDDA